MNKDNHNIANNYFTLLTEAKKKVKSPTEDVITRPLFYNNLNHVDVDACIDYAFKKKKEMA